MSGRIRLFHKKQIEFFKLFFIHEFKNVVAGAYVLGSGFDIKFENTENSRRKSIINKYCNYYKK